MTSNTVFGKIFDPVFVEVKRAPRERLRTTWKERAWRKCRFQALKAEYERCVRNGHSPNDPDNFWPPGGVSNGGARTEMGEYLLILRRGGEQAFVNGEWASTVTSTLE
jgi:hypothetical protein